MKSRKTSGKMPASRIDRIKALNLMTCVLYLGIIALLWLGILFLMPTSPPDKVSRYIALMMAGMGASLLFIKKVKEFVEYRYHYRDLFIQGLMIGFALVLMGSTFAFALAVATRIVAWLNG
jgi:hypothetical protein